jgi:integrase
VSEDLTLGERVTPHSLRRTFASLRYVVGDDPITVGEQGGWSDPSFPMKVYARAVKRERSWTARRWRSSTQPFNGHK